MGGGVFFFVGWGQAWGGGVFVSGGEGGGRRLSFLEEGEAETSRP